MKERKEYILAAPVKESGVLWYAVKQEKQLDASMPGPVDSSAVLVPSRKSISEENGTWNPPFPELF